MARTVYFNGNQYYVNATDPEYLPVVVQWQGTTTPAEARLSPFKITHIKLKRDH
jgi:hypothetical protein